MNEHYENGVLVSSEPLTQEQVDHMNAVADASRKRAYAEEADPLFFKAQRGETTMEVWLTKVAEIKARYPGVAAAIG